jgi:hypothetical protein
MASSNPPTGAGSHIHSPGCGHTAVRHRDHVDYLDHGHLQHVCADRTEEHVTEVTETNPDRCSPSTARTDTNQLISTALTAAMRPSRTAITLITW